MPSGPPTRFSATKIRLIRAVKRVIWPHPRLYYPFGLLRDRGNVLRKDWDMFMGGYPRSANTFTHMAFISANPGVNLLTHRHIPTFVLNLTRCGVPGFVLIRRPLDAAISVAIYANWSLERAVAYWNDYYETLLPVRQELFLVKFEDATRDFGAVMKAFNKRFGTAFVPFDHTPENAARCFQMTEDLCLQRKGMVDELQVCRPSKDRMSIKSRHLGQLDQSDFLRNELARANELYETFLHHRGKEARGATTRLIPEKADGGTMEIGSAARG